MSRLGNALLSTALAAALVAPWASPAQAQGAFVERVATASAVVHDVDLTTRQVLLAFGEGEFVTLVAPEEVRNLPQVAVGDTVNLSFYGGIAASLTPPGEAPMATDLTEALVRAEEGQRPAGAALREFSSTVTFDTYDPATGSVTFTGQSGVTRQVVVEDPEMQAFVETLEAGDMVDVMVIEIIALKVD